MKNLIAKVALAVILTATLQSCNSNKSKGDDTTEAGTQQYDDANSGMDNRTPAGSTTPDSTATDSSSVPTGHTTDTGK